MTAKQDIYPPEFDRARTPLPKKLTCNAARDVTDFIATLNDLSGEATINSRIAFKRAVLRAILEYCFEQSRLLDLSHALKFSFDSITVVSAAESVRHDELLVPIRHPFILAASPFSEHDYSTVRAVNIGGAIATAVCNYIAERRAADFELMCKTIQAARFSNASTRFCDETLEAIYSVFNEAPDVSPSAIQKAMDDRNKALFEGVRLGMAVNFIKITLSLAGLCVTIWLISQWLSK